MDYLNDQSCSRYDSVLSKASILEDYVFRDSGNIGAGGDHSGDIVSTQDIKPGTDGENSGSIQTGCGAFRENAPGRGRIRPLAGGDCRFYAALEK